MINFARSVRLQHLYRRDSGRLLIVPLDHPISVGPAAHSGHLDRLVGTIADAGADAVVLHKGAVRRLRPHRFRELSLLVHLSASTGLAGDPDAKYLVCGVEEALRLGAHGVSVHVNVGSATEERQIADLAAVADACDRWGLPLLAMVYARGPAVPDPHAPDVVAHAVTIAAELGADLVKTALPSSSGEVTAITAACPIPVIAAGGASADPEETFEQLLSAVHGGAGGVAAGRFVFTADDPGERVRRLSALVHGRPAAVAR
ncbi:2-amino-3,7-dideoxy-D-threo-hept-6-ulosonate synthase [Cryptosporangium arvum]|uniref:2-amino-3,7-dideoxy-D-threo-hept-6-ulosonate synthase n=1 Tax=Cryptosporangium arvum TaxID=80871 RepID=UPI0004AFC2B1|nr:2-amino-3,7-dideoxy-D-threo-hept-6-ulosonate synthase [Cryptosporangium arvum]